MPGGVRDILLPGLGRVIRVSGCPEFPSLLETALPGWRMTVIEGEGPAPDIRIAGDAPACRQISPNYPQGVTHESPVAAVCSVTADLVERYLSLHPDLVGLHCASVEINGRLVLFPETHRAGKSTLVAALAGGGLRVFGDDVLVLEDGGRGMALGISPRLRLPLPTPPAVDVALHNYTAAHAAAEDHRYRYLNLPEGQLARHGESLPLGAVVLLERDEQLGKPELVPLAPGEGLTRLLRQHFAHDLPSEALMERFLPLMRSLPCRLLRYPEPLAAARCLRTSLPGVIDSIDKASGAQWEESPARSTAAPVAIDDRWCVASGLREYELGDERFLIEPSSGAIHRLNGTGHLVWGLLQEEAMSGREVSELLVEHFPDVSPARIEADVGSLLAELNDAQLIVSA
ncbi:PqqD family protein [Guyparkeria hydrothermalis]|uniref:PqqD family protein n=1 Tax=Guyparkeria hydrothermalis TaxID=923 RepID=UPI002021A7A8|nr:PqqD family protein [Guyparkeria hydrothermalis]MCL7744151.1 PqqD family protein [Guyparkeria hydrothermalis]